MTITEQRVQIERVVYRCGSPYVKSAATFSLNEPRLFLCRAYIKSGIPLIDARSEPMTLEEAGALMVALQMALEWIAEEMAKRQEDER